MTRNGAARTGGELVRDFTLGARRELFCEGQSVPLDHPSHALAATAVGPRLGAGVQPGDHIRDALHEPDVQPIALSETIEECPLIEADHFDEPVERLTL